jgi:hypothetical protein
MCIGERGGVERGRTEYSTTKEGHKTNTDVFRKGGIKGCSGIWCCP